MSEVSEKRSSGAAESLDALFRSQVHSAEISAALRVAAVAQRCRSNLEWSRSKAFQAQRGEIVQVYSLAMFTRKPMRSRSPSLLPSPGRGGSAGGLEDEVDGQFPFDNTVTVMTG